MENKETFQLTYSAGEQEEIQSIREKYMPKEKSKIEKLRALDAGVNKKATIVSIFVGVIGTLILGAGMSFVMSDLGGIFGANALLIGIVVGSLGIAILACSYPLYHHTLKKEREKIAPEILRLTDELLKP